MSQGTMEGEVAAAVMEQNPRSFHNIIRYMCLCALRIHEAMESAWCISRRDAMGSHDESKWYPAVFLPPADEPINYNTAVIDSGEVKFSMTTASKGDFDINIGSHTSHAPKNSSARHQLLYMMLFACNLLDDTFACPKSMVPTSISKKIRRSSSVSRSAGIARETPADSIGAGYHDAMSDAENLPAASLRLQNKLNIISGMNGLENHTGYMEGLREVTHTKQEHHSHSIMEAGEVKTAATWVVATAAGHHATGNRDLLSGFTPDQPGRFVHPADGAAPMQVVAHGSVITNTVVLPNVLYVPGLTANLVSASQLAELDYTVGFGRGACHIRRAADGTIVGKATVGEDGLFELDYLKVLT